MARGRTITSFGQMFSGLAHGGEAVEVPPVVGEEPSIGGGVGRKLAILGPVPQDDFFERLHDDDDVLVQI